MIIAWCGHADSRAASSSSTADVLVQHSIGGLPAASSSELGKGDDAKLFVPLPAEQRNSRIDGALNFRTGHGGTDEPPTFAASCVR
jgi:hypothetical protein